MVFELRGVGSVDRPVAGVVWAHGELVDHNGSVGALHQLHGEHPHHAELMSDHQRQLLCGGCLLVAQTRRWSCRLYADAISLHGFRDWVRRRLPRRRSHNKGAQFTGEVDEFFTDDLYALTSALERLSCLGCGVQPPDALAVVSTTGGLRHNWPTLFVAERGQGCDVRYHPAGRTWSAQRSQSIAHDRLVLSMHKRGRSGTNSHTG